MPSKRKRFVVSNAQNSTNASSATGDTEQESTVSDVIKDIIAKSLGAQGSSGQSEPVIQMILQAIKGFGEIIVKLDSSLDRLNDRLDKAEADLHMANIEKEKLTIENTKLKADLRTATTQLEMELESRERNQRRFNIKINGMEAGSKPKSEVINDIVNLVNDNTEDAITKDDIYDVDVVKARQSATASATASKRDTLIVSLQDVKCKKKFYALSKKMRDTRRPIFVGDDLTVGQRSLLFQLKQRKDLFSKILFRDGVVRCLKADGGWRSFCYLHELEGLPPTATTVGTSG